MDEKKAIKSKITIEIDSNLYCEAIAESKKMHPFIYNNCDLLFYSIVNDGIRHYRDLNNQGQ